MGRFFFIVGRSFYSGGRKWFLCRRNSAVSVHELVGKLLDSFQGSSINFLTYHALLRPRYPCMWISTKINQWFLPSRWPGLFRQPQLHQGRLRKTTYIHGVPQYNYLSFPMYSWIFSPGLFHSIYNDRLGAFGPPCRGLFFHGRLDFLGYVFLVSFTCPGLGLRKLKKHVWLR